MKLDKLLSFFFASHEFQLLLKGCTIEALLRDSSWLNCVTFQLLLKGCTIEACDDEGDKRYIAKFQLLLKGCTIEALQILS